MLDKVADQRDELHEALMKTQAALAQLQADKDSSEAVMQREIGRVVSGHVKCDDYDCASIARTDRRRARFPSPSFQSALKARESERLQKEIDRLRAVHDLALRDGVFGRGRTHIFGESLKEPKRRANTLKEVASPPPPTPSDGGGRRDAVSHATAAAAALASKTRPKSASSSSISWRGAAHVDDLSRKNFEEYDIGTRVEDVNGFAGAHRLSAYDSPVWR